MNEANIFKDQPIAWKPTRKFIEKAQLTRFMKQIGVSSWDELYQKSIEDIESFTYEVLKFLEIKFNPNYEKLLDTSKGIEWAKWCVGGGLNITEMCLDRWIGTEIENQLAIIWESEEGTVKKVTYRELLKQVESCAAGLRRNGLSKGDTIGIHLPMMIETVVALLAINRIGAIAVPVFSGYGIEAISSRLNAVKAKAFFTCDGFPRRAKNVDAFKVAYEAIGRSTTLEKIFIVNRLANESIFSKLDRRFMRYENLIDSLGKKKPKLSAHELTSANDPAIILYSSGTTGQPKGIAHVHCGFPIKAAQDMAFGTDVGKGTRISWITDIGWMMGPWLIYGALINGAAMVLYDGAPDYPGPDRVWSFCAKNKVEILGISPTLIRALSAKIDDSPKKHDLSSLRAFASTGEPWNPEPWRWLFEKIGNSRLPIINCSGGTEISGGILMGNPLLPQKPCSFPAPCPGMNVDILDENGKSVEFGKVGELVIKDTWIGMARGFWEEDERYLKTYWSKFKKKWVHGDFTMRDEDGHWYILGRSDDTLNVAGKRIGPAEIESLLVADKKVAEAAVIGIPDEIKGTAIVAFCVLSMGGGNLSAISAKQSTDKDKNDQVVLTPEEIDAKKSPVFYLEKELKSKVAKDIGKPLTPKRIHFVSALPKTRNAKVMRRVIRSSYLGESAGDLSALENPNTVREIQTIMK